MKYEIFVDLSYFDMWSVKPFGIKVGFESYPSFKEKSDALKWAINNGATEVVQTHYRPITNDEIRAKYNTSYKAARRNHGKSIHGSIIVETPVWKANEKLQTT